MEEEIWNSMAAGLGAKQGAGVKTGKRASSLRVILGTTLGLVKTEQANACGTLSMELTCRQHSVTAAVLVGRSLFLFSTTGSPGPQAKHL